MVGVRSCSTRAIENKCSNVINIGQKILELRIATWGLSHLGRAPKQHLTEND
jgi:hypothetical protein